MSLKARLAIALHLFASYCRRRGLDHPDITTFIDHHWRFLEVLETAALEAWVADVPPLVAAALGDDFTPSFAAFLARSGGRASEFRRAITYTTELVNSNLYCATDEAGSRAFLKKVALVAGRYGVAWPDLAVYAGSRWADGSGWGAPLRAEQVAAWRAAGDAESGGPA